MQPKVTLISFTQQPVEIMMWSFMQMHHVIPSDLEVFIKNEKDKLDNDDYAWIELKKEFLLLQSINPHATTLEFVNTIWHLDGVSRAFQQQLTRHRQASYSIASLRIVPMDIFADNEMYAVPENIKRNAAAKSIFDETMKYIQDQYNKLRATYGINTEDARGVLPLNVQSPITMCINLRSLMHLAEARLCLLAQGEFREVVRLMIEEVLSKMGQEFEVLFKKPCERLGFCPMPICCGHTSFKQHKVYENIKIDKWLKG